MRIPTGAAPDPSEDPGEAHLLPVRIVRKPLSLQAMEELAREQFGDMVKAVVDVACGIMAVGGELHADEEAALLDDESRQENLWGINLYVGRAHEEWIEFDSLINLRPTQGNRSRDVEDPEIRERIRQIVDSLVQR